MCLRPPHVRAGLQLGRFKRDPAFVSRRAFLHRVISKLDYFCIGLLLKGVLLHHSFMHHSFLHHVFLHHVFLHRVFLHRVLPRRKRRLV